MGRAEWDAATSQARYVTPTTVPVESGLLPDGSESGRGGRAPFMVAEEGSARTGTAQVTRQHNMVMGVYR